MYFEYIKNGSRLRKALTQLFIRLLLNVQAAVGAEPDSKVALAI